jgi:prepilin-type processing-associated H-X9-DG protein
MYANSYNQVPPDLATILKNEDITADVFVDPLHPEEKNGFVYIPPQSMKDLSANGQLAVLYEKWPEGLNVGFADGHVEWFPTRAAVEQQVKAAEAHNKEAAQKK